MNINGIDKIQNSVKQDVISNGNIVRGYDLSKMSEYDVIRISEKLAAEGKISLEESITIAAIVPMRIEDSPYLLNRGRKDTYLNVTVELDNQIKKKIINGADRREIDIMESVLNKLKKGYISFQ